MLVESRSLLACPVRRRHRRPAGSTKLALPLVALGACSRALPRGTLAMTSHPRIEFLRPSPQSGAPPPDVVHQFDKPLSRFRQNVSVVTAASARAPVMSAMTEIAWRGRRPHCRRVSRDATRAAQHPAIAEWEGLLGSNERFQVIRSSIRLGQAWPAYPGMVCRGTYVGHRTSSVARHPACRPKHRS